MRRLLLALPFTLLPLTAALAHDDHDEHASLGKHEHGTATLNVAFEGEMLELALESPAINLVGFEHAASSEADQAKVAAARTLLEHPLGLFGLDSAATCQVHEQRLDSPLFGAAPAADEHTGHAHSDIDASYQLTCAQPQQLKALDLSGFFRHFPGTSKIAVQLIGPAGQLGAELTPSNPRLTF
ncbi:DUF2796 domain-containing protein [Pseudomonas sp. UL073]|uniref:DUF2796 domain-containing protein n=1 Tax=Zestomonas insulae TaxID=2809017 RepID=A0ABS2II64_9GAMM|nr:DUF2796 domain-containing protein [Pseudomonas insulae]MBM7062755.1 DUF2796 domain-containing protein [Pseudomonas insulae]